MKQISIRKNLYILVALIILGCSDQASDFYSGEQLLATGNNFVEQVKEETRRVELPVSLMYPASNDFEVQFKVGYNSNPNYINVVGQNDDSIVTVRFQRGDLFRTIMVQLNAHAYQSCITDTLTMDLYKSPFKVLHSRQLLNIRTSGIMTADNLTEWEGEYQDIHTNSLHRITHVQADTFEITGFLGVPPSLNPAPVKFYFDYKENEPLARIVNGYFYTNSTGRVGIRNTNSLNEALIGTFNYCQKELTLISSRQYESGTWFDIGVSYTSSFRRVGQ